MVLYQIRVVGFGVFCIADNQRCYNGNTDFFLHWPVEIQIAIIF